MSFNLTTPSLPTREADICSLFASLSASQILKSHKNLFWDSSLPPHDHRFVSWWRFELIYRLWFLFAARSFVVWVLHRFIRKTVYDLQSWRVRGASPDNTRGNGSSNWTSAAGRHWPAVDVMEKERCFQCALTEKREQEMEIKYSKEEWKLNLHPTSTPTFRASDELLVYGFWPVCDLSSAVLLGALRLPQEETDFTRDAFMFFESFRKWSCSVRRLWPDQQRAAQAGCSSGCRRDTSTLTPADNTGLSPCSTSFHYLFIIFLLFPFLVKQKKKKKKQHSRLLLLRPRINIFFCSRLKVILCFMEAEFSLENPEW